MQIAYLYIPLSGLYILLASLMLDLFKFSLLEKEKAIACSESLSER